MNTIEIKTDLSGEKLQVLMWDLDAFCEMKRLPKPVLLQTDVTCRACSNCKETVEVCACIRNRCIKCGDAVGNITFTVCDKCWDIEHGR